MYPSPAAASWIDGFAAGLSGGWAANTDAAIVAAANAATVDNPAPQGTVPKPYTFGDLVGQLDATAAANLCGMAGLDTLIAQINSSDATAAARWVGLLELAGKIAPAQGSAMLAIVRATEPDPSWPPRIGAAQAALGRPVDAADVSEARDQHAPGTQH